MIKSFPACAVAKTTDNTTAVMKGKGESTNKEEKNKKILEKKLADGVGTETVTKKTTGKKKPTNSKLRQLIYGSGLTFT